MPARSLLSEDGQPGGETEIAHKARGEAHRLDMSSCSGSEAGEEVCGAPGSSVLGWGQLQRGRGCERSLHR